MDREQLLGHYEWSVGVCFRHPAAGGTETTVIKTLYPPDGGREVVRACQECVLRMESQRREAALEGGFVYEPGRVGQELHPN
ncbi:hypothetical protein [Streptomyces sp. KN37]|uniref:hypothetical protein n=1 Tax=Streptomyces sp. KN37 TaxID=3090667 RepID=UPI002A74F7BE|nr:hypothetical protein [Streptomyces sp. KN37]WPO70173.1 hypothetical protein R9806_05800 [Streptomyces sp. KN37]